MIGLELQLALLENIDLAGEVIAVDEDDDVGFLGERDDARAERNRAHDDRSHQRRITGDSPFS